MPEKKIRGVRVPDERWKQAQEKAAREGRTVSDVINECLEKYVSKDDKPKR